MFDSIPWFCGCGIEGCGEEWYPATLNGKGFILWGRQIDLYRKFYDVVVWDRKTVEQIYG